MKLLVFGGGIPTSSYRHENVTAINIVMHEIIRELISRGHEIAYQCIMDRSLTRSELTSSEAEALQELKKGGVHVFEPLFPKDYVSYAPVRLRTFRMLWDRKLRMLQFYPSICLEREIQERMKGFNVDAILSLWTNDALAATQQIDIPKVAYHGDLDFESQLCVLKNQDLFNPNPRRGFMRFVDLLDQRMRNVMYKRTHVALMRGVDFVANITDRNAKFYTKHGHPNSIYVGNLWVDPEEAVTPSFNNETFKIIGHMGSLGNTGSAFGLKFLLQEVLPHLDEVFGDCSYELHIIGGGKLPEILKPHTKHPKVYMQGFVKDLNPELRSCDVFCVLNNAGPYQAAFTRHMVGWSLGLCLVAHQKSTLAIPEIAHEENALLGSTGREVAQSIARAALDLELNMQLRRKGRETYEAYFTPAIVTRKLEKCLSQSIDNRR
ncbi:MAG: glycosyltransferase [Patescibacteria group bacterium]